MRRFALTNLRDFGMGKRACEDKIIEECQRLLEVFKKFKGEAFDTNQRLSYAVSNIICSMVYGSRFEYNDPEFTSLVDRMSRGAKLLGSPSVQMYNMCPALFKWSGARKELLELSATSTKQNRAFFRRLQETLNPQMCRGFVDAFLVRKQTLEESGITNSHFHDDNLLMTVMNLFAAGTETTSTTLRWALLLMAKYPKIQGRRVCLGESLARMELFLFFTTLLQHFRFTPAPGVSEDELDLTPAVGFALSPLPHKLRAISRM
ncbi:unnamed protein product [Oreochromis niloticus]|nr:unnamed protein product [Mustela putorius furo]